LFLEQDIAFAEHFVESYSHVMLIILQGIASFNTEQVRRHPTSNVSVGEEYAVLLVRPWCNPEHEPVPLTSEVVGATTFKSHGVH
jgi:hypothetical protein